VIAFRRGNGGDQSRARTLATVQGSPSSGERRPSRVIGRWPANVARLRSGPAGTAPDRQECCSFARANIERLEGLITRRCLGW